MKKMYKYIIAAVAVSAVAYFSVSFENLEEVKERQRAVTFNAAEYARDLWDNRLNGVLDNAVDAEKLIELFNTNMSAAIEKYGRTPGVSRVYAYLLKGEGKILTIGEDFLEISIKEPWTKPDIRIITGFYIPGNAVRDASGLVDVSEFSDTMKFNEISSEINKIVVKKVIRPFLDKNPQAGDTIGFIGATQVAQDAAEETPFGQLVGDSAEGKEFHLVRVVPIRLESK
jgi:predicted lipoprotein